MWIQRGKTLLIQLIIVIMFFLAGCQTKNGTASENDKKNTGYLDNMGQYDFLEELNLVWKDNSLDDLQAAFNLPIEEVKQEGERAFRTIYDIKEDRIVAFRNHLLGFRDSWSGISGVNNQGEVFSEVIMVDPEREGRQIDLLGPSARGKGYAAYKYVIDESGNISGQWFYTLDEYFKKVSEFYVDKPLGRNTVNAVAEDGSGNIHVIFRISEEESSYLIFSAKGEKLFETTIGHPFTWHEFYAMDSGQIIVCMEDCNNWQFIEADLQSGKINVLAELTWETIRKQALDHSNVSSYACVKSENELVYCNADGIYVYDVQKKLLKMVYKWANHGIVPQEFLSVSAKEDGTVRVIYLDLEGPQYLLLKPKFEETEIKSIIFAVTPEHKSIYTSAAAAFNKKYPTYNIVLKDDYEETPLLTQLGSGEGPVIVDTKITGFEALKKLWQSLDGYLEKTGLVDELYPQALEFGRIGDNTYGIVTSFAIESLLVGDSKLLGWNYDEFLNAVENSEVPVFSYEYVSEPSDYRKRFFDILSNGEDDNAYFEKDKGTVNFGTPKFERILSLAENANPCLPFENGTILSEGKSLCEIVYVSNVKRLVNTRMRLESGEVFVVGHPMKAGAKHLLEADAPITIRSTATDEEKQMAYTFFKLLLSHESAMQLTNNSTIYTEHFSVRKEILEEQFKTYERIYEINGDPAIDKEKERVLFEELLENSVIKRSFPATLQSVFDEEINAYLDGEIPGELLDSRLKSRVSLYLDEN